MPHTGFPTDVGKTLGNAGCRVNAASPADRCRRSTTLKWRSISGVIEFLWNVILVFRAQLIFFDLDQHPEKGFQVYLASPRLWIGLAGLLAVAVAWAPVGASAQARGENSNGIYQILTVGQFSAEDEARIRQLVATGQRAAAPAAQQPPAQQPPGQQPPATPPLQPGQVGPRVVPPAAPPAPGQQAQPPAAPAAPRPDPLAGRPIITGGSGTGFLIAGQRTIATNNHVAIPPPLVLNGVTFQPNRAVWFAAFLRDGVAMLTPLRLITREASKDLALFEAESDLPGRAFAIADYDPSLDLEVEAVGFPGVSDIMSVEADQRIVDTSIAGLRVPLSMSQLQPIKTQGRVQRLVDAQLQIPGQAALRARTILHSASISPGNSGGPLLNRCGHVVGMNTFTRSNQNAKADFSVHTRELVEVMRAQSIVPTVATSFCFFPGTVSDYVPHLVGLWALLLGAAALGFAVHRKPQIVQQTAQRFSQVFSRPVTRDAAGGASDPHNAPDVDRPTRRAARPPAPGRGGGEDGQRQDPPANVADADLPYEATGPATAVGITEPQGRSARLISLQGRDPLVLSADALMKGQSVIVGRDTVSDAVLDETSVSRRHARLTLDAADNLVITDLGSANGTWLGNRNISTASFAPGDELRFGTQRYRWEIDGSGGSNSSVKEAAWRVTGEGENGELISVTLVPKTNAAGAPVETEWSVGRNENVCNICIKAADVSSNHAVLRWRPDSGLQIADRGSANGTWINGQRIGAEFTSLSNGESVHLGEVELTLRRA